ncbi:class D sortase [Barrientosiimonas marina]|uniref:Class D sortase n=1 Tax=Lentibacillus kimchii TaxID=1542911 RepID=A0ABW2UVA3_9BACI
MKKFGITLVIFGLVIVSWYGYQWWNSQQSVTDLDEKEVAVAEDSDQQQTDHESDPTLSASNKQDDHVKEDHHKPEIPDYQEGEEVAKLTIPKLEKAFSVYWGTNRDTLKKGVGEYVSKWTVPPDQGGHTVLSGHNNTVFEELGDLDDGDLLYMTYQGKDYQYKINKTWITTEDDRSVIVQKDDPTLTLTTCYPFGYIQYTPKRYIVQANLIDEGDLLSD